MTGTANLRELLTRNMRTSGIYIAFVAIVALFAFLTGGTLLSPGNVTNIVLQYSYILILAIGMVMVIIAGHIDLSVGSVVAVTGASNLIGTRPPVAEIAEAAHAVGALVFVDGVHLTAHAPVDVAALGADLFACSPYKFLGPHLGCVVASPDLLETLHPDKLLPSTDAVPERFELGTLPYELLAGTTAAVDFLAGLGGTDGDRRARLRAGITAVP